LPVEFGPIASLFRKRSSQSSAKTSEQLLSDETFNAPSERLRASVGCFVFWSSLFLVVVFSVIVMGQWSRDPSAALTLPEDYFGYQIVPDSLGGVFISAWDGYYRAIYYYIDPNGFPRWNRWIDTAPLADFSQPADYIFCPEPGVIVTLGYSFWITEEGDTSWDLRAQKINTEGEFLWSDSGVVISDRRLRPDDWASFGVLEVVTDGEGGVIVIWRIDFYEQDEWGSYVLVRTPRFAQRISADGELLWEPDSNLIQYPPHQIVSDGEGGFITLTAPYNQSPFMKYQRISHNGEPLWGDSGRRLELNVVGVNAIPDGFGGMVFSGQSAVDDHYQVRVFRINADGDQLWGDGNGVVVKDVYYEQGRYLYNNWIMQASDSVFFVHWKGDGHEEPHPLIQAVTLNGELIWDWPGVTVCDADSIGHTMQGIGSVHSVIYGWTGYRPGNEYGHAFYCQRLDVDGNRLWQNEGITLFNRSGISISNVVTDCNGGAIFHIGGLNIQYINRNGELGVPLTIRSFDQPLAEGIIQYSLFPNPTNSVTALRFFSTSHQARRIMIFDLQGRLTFQDIIPSGAASHTLEVSSLPSGIYILQIQSVAFDAHQTLNIIK